MKNSTPSTVTAQPASEEAALPRSLGLWNALTLVSGFSALFFLLTNGVPFIQLGLVPELLSKTRYIQTVRISFAVFILPMIFLSWNRPEVFRRLWLIELYGKILTLPFWIPIAILYGVYVTELAAVCLMNHYVLGTRAFDLGIFAQAIWNTTQGDFLYSSLKEGICLLGDHISPILAVMAPLYSLWPDPRLLLVIQPLISAISLILIAYGTRRKTGDSELALLFALIYFFHPHPISALHEDFHPEVIAEPFLLAAFFALEARKRLPFLACLLIAASGKENMLGITLMLGAYALLFTEWKRTGLAVIAASLFLFIWEIGFLVPRLTGASYYYQSFFHHSGAGNFLGILLRLISSDNVEYVLRVFAPFLFLPFTHFPTLLLTFPVLFQNLLSVNPLMRSFGYHYTTGLTPFLFISALYGLLGVTKKFNVLAPYRTKIAVLILIAVVTNFGPSEYYYFWQAQKQHTPHHSLVREKLREIPPNALVLTHANFIPQISNRKFIFQFNFGPSPSKVQDAERRKVDYVIFDRAFWESETEPLETTLEGLTRSGYQTVFSENGFYILKHG